MSLEPVQALLLRVRRQKCLFVVYERILKIGNALWMIDLSGCESACLWYDLRENISHFELRQQSKNQGCLKVESYTHICNGGFDTICLTHVAV